MAKGTATRYLSSEGAAPLEAREVVRRYVAALQETGAAQGQDLLAGFRLTRKAAQSLGAFGDILGQAGWTAALEKWGLGDVAQTAPETAISGLTSAWLEDHQGLEAAAARTALVACLVRVLAAGSTSPPGVNGPSLVKSFLAIMLSQRLAFDLGEPLEAAAPAWPQYRQGLARLEKEVQDAAAAMTEDPPEAGQWQGLAGWLWVTRVLERVLQRFQDHGA
jgi:hypothetical protein